MSEPITLTDETIEAIANRVADLLEPRLAPAFKQPPELIDAAEVARRLGIRREAVYEHADRLGAHRIGNGPRGRLRFDPERIGLPARRSVARSSLWIADPSVVTE